MVGRLGVRADSLLSDDVVLADPSQFSASPQRLLLDGPDSVRHYTAQFPGRSVEIIDDGTNRRTNVDAVSPVLVTLGALVVTLIAVVAGLQAGRWELRTAAVRFTTGFRPLNTLRSAAARVALIGTAACTTALAGAASVRQTTTLDLDVTTAVIAVGSVVFAVSVASFWQGSRRWNC